MQRVIGGIMNKIILSGNLCQEIQLKYTNSNIPVVSNAIAVKNDFKNADGVYESQFINFIAYRNNAEYLTKYADKGSKVLLEGKLNNRSYEDKEGVKKYITEVIIDKVEIFTFKKEEKVEEKVDVYEQFGKIVEEESLDLPF